MLKTHIQYQAAPLEWEEPVRSGPRLLVVEDDKDLMTFLRRIAFRVEPDLAVDWAGSVADARKLMHRQPYDLVLADYVLDTHESGLVLRSWLERRYPQVGFAMMSAYPIGDYLAYSGPGCPFLPKPFTVKECRRFLSQTLAN